MMVYVGVSFDIQYSFLHLLKTRSNSMKFYICKYAQNHEMENFCPH